jgi:hypothetical protein
MPAVTVRMDAPLASTWGELALFSVIMLVSSI